MTICETQNLRRYYGHGEEAVKAVDGVSFSITQGSFTAITGPSGSGKSTLLHLLGGLDRPTEGKVLFRGKDLYANREDACPSSGGGSSASSSRATTWSGS